METSLFFFFFFISEDVCYGDYHNNRPTLPDFCGDFTSLHFKELSPFNGSLQSYFSPDRALGVHRVSFILLTFFVDTNSVSVK